MSVRDFATARADFRIAPIEHIRSVIAVLDTEISMSVLES
jgi:hypothetical protein